MAAIIDTMKGAYPFISNKGLKQVESKVKWFIGEYLKSSFEARMKDSLASVLTNYNSKSNLRSKNREAKVNEMMKVAEKAAQGAWIAHRFDEEKDIEDVNISDVKLMTTRNVSDLYMFFEQSLNDGYFDVKKALETNKKWAKELQTFFEEIALGFNSKYGVQGADGSISYKGTDDERAKALRQIILKSAVSIYRKYPYTWKMRVQNFGNDYSVDLREQNIAVMDNTYVAHRDYRVDFNLGSQSAVDLGVEYTAPRHPRNNPDKLTTGEIGKPIAINDKGFIEAHNGVDYLYNSSLLNIFLKSGALDKKIVAEAEGKTKNMVGSANNLKNIYVQDKNKI